MPVQLASPGRSAADLRAVVECAGIMSHEAVFANHVFSTHRRARSLHSGSLLPVPGMRHPTLPYALLHVRRFLYRPSLTLNRWPRSGHMNQSQYPHRSLIDLVHQSIIFMGNQFTGARYFPWLAKHRKIDQPCRRIAKNFIHANAA